MITFKNIVFYNYFHNGDIHLSRTFVQKIIETISALNSNINFYYAHRNNPTLLSDIPHLIHSPAHFSQIKSEKLGDFIIGDSLYINTWYASNNFAYMNNYGITFDCLYALFDDVCRRQFSFGLADIAANPCDFFPNINYANYQINNITTWVSNVPNKKILISNCSPLSDQAHNLNLTSITCQISKLFKDYYFILTNRQNVNQKQYPNVLFSGDIIKKPGPFDLNENAFLSTFCDVIVGPASGAFTFAMTQDNFFNRKEAMIGLCNLIPNKPGKFWLSRLFEDSINYSANVVIDNSDNEKYIVGLLTKQIQK